MRAFVSSKKYEKREITNEIMRKKKKKGAYCEARSAGIQIRTRRVDGGGRQTGSIKKGKRRSNEFDTCN